MKNLKFEFTGDSNLVYVYLFKVDVIEKLEAIEPGEYDFIDFTQANASKELIIGNGLDLDGNLDVRVSQDGELFYDKGVYWFESPATTLEELEADFQEDADDPSVSYLDVLSVNFSSPQEVLDGAQFFFADDSDYLFAAIERVECSSASATATINANDGFKLGEIRPVFVDIDTGSSGSLMQKLYPDSGLEKQIIALVYQGEKYKINLCDDEGRWNEVNFYRRSDGCWEDATEVHEMIDELNDD